MLRKKITYTDYDGNERTETFHFNLSEPELIEMEMGVSGGFSAMMQRIVDEKETTKIVSIFREIIMKSYGEKSADGKHFVKSPELSLAFTQTEAYTVLYMEMLNNPDYAVEFFKGIMPAKVQKQMEEDARKQLNGSN